MVARTHTLTPSCWLFDVEIHAHGYCCYEKSNRKGNVSFLPVSLIQCNCYQTVRYISLVLLTVYVFVDVLSCMIFIYSVVLFCCLLYKIAFQIIFECGGSCFIAWKRRGYNAWVLDFINTRNNVYFGWIFCVRVYWFSNFAAVSCYSSFHFHHSFKSVWHLKLNFQKCYLVYFDLNGIGFFLPSIIHVWRNSDGRCWHLSSAIQSLHFCTQIGFWRDCSDSIEIRITYRASNLYSENESEFE